MQPSFGDLYGNITLFGVTVDHLCPAGSCDPSTNSMILLHTSPDSGSYVILSTWLVIQTFSRVANTFTL